MKLFDNKQTIWWSPTWRHSLHLLAEADIELADRDQGLALQLGLSEQFVDWNIICGVWIDLLPHLVSTIQAVVATLTIALVWTLVRISWPWHLTQVRVVARRQPDHRHRFWVNPKAFIPLYSQTWAREHVWGIHSSRGQHRRSLHQPSESKYHILNYILWILESEIFFKWNSRLICLSWHFHYIAV